MAEITVRVTEKVAALIGWMNTLDIEEIRGWVRGWVTGLKEKAETNEVAAKEWDPILEPNDGVDQWKSGGDCNLCRKVGYCMKKCRANRRLTKLTTPLLYQKFLEANPDQAAEHVTPEDIAEMVDHAQ